MVAGALGMQMPPDHINGTVKLIDSGSLAHRTVDRFPLPRAGHTSGSKNTSRWSLCLFYHAVAKSASGAGLLGTRDVLDVLGLGIQRRVGHNSCLQGPPYVWVLFRKLPGNAVPLTPGRGPAYTGRGGEPPRPPAFLVFRSLIRFLIGWCLR